MTRRLPAPCAEANCPTITTHVRCPKHARPRRRHPAWPRTRRAVLTAEPACRGCGAPATTVDHITPLADGGPELDPTNLQPLCAPCHATKTRHET